MKMYLRSEIKKQDVPEEFVQQALDFLAASRKLNSDIESGAFPGSYHRGQASMWLAFHAIELFLKGCILKKAPHEKISGHILGDLHNKLGVLHPGLELTLPFQAQNLPPNAELDSWAKEVNRTVHERIRYPTANSGDPWQGEKSYFPGEFSETLSLLEKQMNKIHHDIFIGG